MKGIVIKITQIVIMPLLIVAFANEQLLALQNTDQDHTVNGVVTDEGDGSPLPGVNIVVKGTTIGTSTNVEGAYELNATSPEDTLIYSFVGYQTQMIPISGRTEINVALVGRGIIGEELIVTGYGVQRQNEITGSVTTVDVQEITEMPNHNPLESLQGRVAGLNITRDGTPGGGIRDVLIRGINTLGDNSPLFIVDGQPVNQERLNSISANDIENMQVLKDAAAASIYGARASNGVVLITTKQPKGEEFSISVSSSASIEQFHSTLDMVNTRQRGRALWQASVNDGTNPSQDHPHYNFEWHTEDGVPVLDELNVIEWLDEDLQGGIRSGDTDWFEQIKQRGFITDNSISLSSGSDRSSVLFSLGHHSNQGIVKFTDYERLKGRVNSRFDFFDGKLTVGEKFQFTNSTQTPLGEEQGGSQLNLAIISLPILPVFAEDGSFAGPIGAGFSNRMNPLHVAHLNRDWENSEKSAFGNIYLEFTPIENLTFNSNLGLDFSEQEIVRILPRFREGFLSRDINEFRSGRIERNDWSWYNTLIYNFDLGDHSATVMGGIEAIKEEMQTLEGVREDFLVENIEFFQISAGSGASNVSGTSTGSRLLSYFSKMDYSYSNKYLASVTLRYDGSSRFGEDEKFGFFPAFSVGWRLTEEDFFRDNISTNTVSELLIRYGMGTTGNQRIGNDAARGLFIPAYSAYEFNRYIGSAYDLNGANSGTLPSGVVARQAANPNLKWESTDEINIGLDFGFLSDKVNGSFDYFMRETSNILVQPPFSAVVGERGVQWRNGATMENKGWEVVLGYNDQIGEFGYQINGSIASFEDEVTFVPESTIRAYAGNSEKTIIGQSITSIFGYVTDGIFQNQAEVEAHAEQSGKGVGRLRYKDLNGDGEISTLDQDWIGTSIPDFEFGLQTVVNYKQFRLTAYLQGVQGVDRFNNIKNVASFIGANFTGQNNTTHVLDSWTPQNRDTHIPALSNVDNNNENRVSTFNVEDASYIKLRNLRLGYTLPDRIIESIGMSQASVYISGTELFTIKTGDFTGPDPETPGQIFPISRTISLGLNATF